MLRRLCLAIGMLMACQTSHAREPEVPTPLAPQLQVELIETQNEMAVEVPQTAAAVGMQFGLIGALVGAGIQDQQAKGAEARAIPVRDLLVEYRFNEKFEAALRKGLASEGLSPDPKLTVRKSVWEAVDAEHAGSVPLEALVLIPGYSMDYNFGQLSVTLAVQYVKRKIKSNGKIKTHYDFFRFYRYRFPMRQRGLPVKDGNWTSLGKERLSACLDEAIGQLVDMLAFDFSPEGRALWRQKVGDKELAWIDGLAFPGRQLKTGPHRTWAVTGRKWTELRGYHPILVGGDGIALAEPAVAEPADEVPVAPTAPVAGMPADAGAPSTGSGD